MIVGVFVGGGLLVRVKEISSEGLLLMDAVKVIEVDSDIELDVLIVIDMESD